jgi:hypothetical protein
VATAAERLDGAHAALRLEADDDPDEGDEGDPDEDVQRQVSPRLRHHEGEHEAGVGHREGAAHVVRVHGHPHQQAQRHDHGAREPHPARRHEHPVPGPMQVAHDGVAGEVRQLAVLAAPLRVLHPPGTLVPS